MEIAVFQDDFPRPVEGHFKIEVIDKKTQEVIDSYEEKNKIMLGAKVSMQQAMRGNATSSGNLIFINTFVLGTRGHENDNLLTPKDFNYNLSDLFAVQESAPAYPITFDKYGNIIDEGYDPNLPNSAFTDTRVNIYEEADTDRRTIVYEFLIYEENANNNGNPIAYTEAALYTNLGQNIDPNNLAYGTIFSMRTFPAKIKDNTTQLKITWRIIF